jgi:hypothetical protein
MDCPELLWTRHAFISKTVLFDPFDNYHRSSTIPIGWRLVLQSVFDAPRDSQSCQPKLLPFFDYQDDDRESCISYVRVPDRVPSAPVLMVFTEPIGFVYVASCMGFGRNIVEGGPLQKTELLSSTSRGSVIRQIPTLT